MKYEYCCNCSEPTGKAGAGDDSLYTDNDGPFCEDCFPDKERPQRTWVGLTDDERNDCLVSADPCEALAEPEARQLMEDVEAKLKEKNSA